MEIQILYHWSPSGRRHSIHRNGLKVNQRNTIATVAQPHLCFGINPHQAWLLSGDRADPMISGIWAWDLWMVNPIARTDEVHILPQWGGTIGEIWIKNNIGRDRVWLVGTRNIAEHVG